MATEFDHGQLEAITGGDLEFEREVLEEYLGSAPKDVDKLAGAIATGDAHATAQAAHALKGASATIGASGFAALALTLELAGKQGDLSHAPAACEALQREFAELVSFLRERIAKAA